LKVTQITRVFLVFSVFFLEGCSVVGYQGVDEAPYTVVREEGDFELRNYPPLILAETFVDADWEEAQKTAFNRLFDYIRGNNIAEQKIAMTAPVFMNEAKSEKISMTAPVFREKTEKGWRMAFVFPERYSATTAPKPKDLNIKIVELEPRSVAVRTFSGSMELAEANIEIEELSSWLFRSKLQAVGEPKLAGYDPPWTLPWFRRNEVQIQVVPAE